MSAVSGAVQDGDDANDAVIRPGRLADFVGQGELKEHLRVVLGSARLRGVPVDHMLFAGPPGLGKTTLAGIVAVEMGASLRATSGPTLTRPGDLASLLADLQDGDVLFIDEIHRLSREVEEVLYSAMEDFVLDVLVGEGETSRTLRIDLPRFTLVGATTRSGMIAGPLRDRFGLVERLDHYTVDELTQIVQRSSRILGYVIEEDAAREVASRSRGTPRVANRLLRRVIDLAVVDGHDVVTRQVASDGVSLFGVDERGLDKVDRMILDAVCVRFSGGPVGLTTLAHSVGEQPETVEDVHEPFLLSAGLIARTPRGRVATPAGWAHLGMEAPAK